MKRFNNKEKYLITLLLAFFIAFIPRLIIACNMIPLRTLSDELATFSSAATLAGYNWRDVVSTSGYYGFGFYWIFFVLFKITDDPIIIYRTTLIICSLVQALAAPICFYMLGRFFNIKSNMVKLLFSTICSFMVVTRATVMYNEHILILLSWILALIICFLWEDTNSRQVKKKRWHTAVLLLVLIYSLTIHTRSLTYFFAIGIAIILYWLLYRKLLVSKFFFPMLVVGYMVSKVIVQIVQKSIWLIADGSKLPNTNIKINMKYDFWNPDTWKSIANTIFGQTATITVFTGGLFLLLIIIIISSSYFYIFKKSKDHKHTELILLISWIFIMCIGATILAQSLSWFQGVFTGFQKDLIEDNYYSYKAFTYVRYFGPFIGPAVMCGLAVCYDNFKIFHKVKYSFVAISLLLQFYWFTMIMPYVCNNANAQEVFIAFSFMKNGDKTNIKIYLAGLFIWSIFIIFYLFCKKLSVFYFILSLLAIILIHEYCYTAINYDLAIAKDNFQRIDKSYVLIKNLEADLKKNQINDIYFFDQSDQKGSQTYHETYNLYQFYLNRFHIIPEMPDFLTDEAIVFTNTEIKTMTKNENYFMFQCDKNEFVYVKGNNLVELFEKYNLELIPFK